MSTEHPLRSAIAIVGLMRLARELGVSYQAVQKWLAAGRLPRTEWTGETSYAQRMQELTDGKVSKTALLSKWPAGEAEPSAPVLVAPAAVPLPAIAAPRAA